eukprot:2421619-Alexandrium_andersonii.AAC.1
MLALRLCGLRLFGSRITVARIAGCGLFDHERANRGVEVSDLFRPAHFQMDSCPFENEPRAGHQGA